MASCTTEKDHWFIRIPTPLYERIVEVAKAEDRSIASAARTLLRESLKHRVEVQAHE
jgi:hypothetical protein